MNIDLSSIPTTLDMFHLVLFTLSLISLSLLVMKRKSVTNQTNEAVAPQKTAQAIEPQKAKPAQLKEATPDAALQLLTLLQQDARFIDFIKEDLSSYSDADIGAAARVVHEGSKKTLETYFSLKSIRNEDEETRITLPEGFNASEVRLTGNVVGEAPFNGTLIHKGWKVTDIRLPKMAAGHNTAIVAPAEVEL